MKDFKNRMGKAVSVLLIVSLLASCTPMNLTGPERPKEKELVSVSARMLEDAYEDVRAILIEAGEYSAAEFDSHGFSDGETVTRSLMEEGGEEYLEFLYAMDRYKSVDEVLDAASSFVDKENMQELRQKAHELEIKLEDAGRGMARELNATQKEEFYKDLRSLVVKSVVLMTAATVYLFVPNVIFWGKVSAATAVSVAAGVVASTLITIVEWADKDTSMEDDTFSNWLASVTVDPFTNWALAQGIINAQAAVSESPVTAALILGVFAIYNVIDSAKLLLEKYNFNV